MRPKGAKIDALFLNQIGFVSLKKDYIKNNKRGDFLGPKQNVLDLFNFFQFWVLKLSGGTKCIL